MLLVFGFALLVVAAAVVVLFAMMGELASRVPAADERQGWVRPLDEARMGRVPDRWPAALELAPQRESYTLLVLSTVCSSCKLVAATLAGDHGDWDDMAVVVSTSSRRNGEDFISEHALGGFAHHVDEGGDWVNEELGVQSSPTAVVLRRGRVVAAYAFSDVRLLRSEVGKAGQPVHEREAV